MLPKNLKYGSKVESAVARSSRVNIAPQNGTAGYNLGDTIIVNIPTRNNLVMATTESYLKFTVNALTAGAGSNGLRFDSCGAHGLIQRIRIWSGSNLLEDIDNYGLLAKMLYDVQMPTDSAYGKCNILCGTRNDLVVKLPTSSDNTAANIAVALSGTTASVNQINSGESLKKSDLSTAVLANADTTATYTFCLNLISLVGSLCSGTYLPLFGLTSAPLRVEIMLVDQLYKAFNQLAAFTVPASGLLSNVEFVANFIELGDSAMSMIAGSLQGQPLQFTAPAFRNYQYSYSLATAQTQVTMPIPAKFSSLKAIFITVRDKGTGALTFFPFSSVTCKNIDYQFRVGAQVMPPKPPNASSDTNYINAYGEHFSELLKAIGSISDLNHQPSIEKTSYTLVNSAANTSGVETNNASNISSGSFYIGLDLENYAASSKETIFSGWNSNTDDIYCIMNFAAQDGATTVRFDGYANFDVVYVCENNTMYAKF